MQFDKKEMERELAKIIDTSKNEKDLKRQLIIFWDEKLKNAYGDDKDLMWFLNTLDKNNEAIREDNTNPKVWEQTVNMFNNIANGANIDYLFDCIQNGGSFDYINNNGDTALVFAMEDNDLVTASLVMIMSRTKGTTSFPADDKELFQTNNAMLTAFQSDPRFLKLLLATNPNNCYKLDNEHAVMHELNQIEQTENIRKNLEIYRQFVDLFTPTQNSLENSETYNHPIERADFILNGSISIGGESIIVGANNTGNGREFEHVKTIDSQSQIFANALKHAKGQSITPAEGLEIAHSKFNFEETDEQNKEPTMHQGK